jgi:O-antigen/teichoic acid export membrane protein
MTYFGKTRYVYYCSVAVAIISIGANNIMIPKFQIFGAGLTILMAGIIGFLINAMVARKLLSLEHVRNKVAGAKDK